MQINIGLDDDARRTIADRLSHLLADTSMLYLTTHAFHWNVTGPMFQTLHVMFEEHYLEMRDAIDEIAERIRALGELAPGSYAAFARLSSVEDSDDTPEAMAMVERLVIGHEALIRTARGVVETAEKIGDTATADLATQRLQIHEKTAWMLRSLLA